ncbi:OLC1v1033851C2 [Oldenlandia corymbosa var. corymbosa]|uniref:DNA helicase n=1 Tax=Oldenlandia corymbosa var. corymbosa TaxID=529605 RepID=A0AAV1CS45_OLDCO|nr:OLC1v1033851C2 [Oldenlandia corymbosa var. corymbosa]
MASKGPRSKLDHETRAKRQKALEAPKEPQRPKTHWDHVLEEMVWLSKDFESERKWKLAQAKKVATRASKGMLDQATRGEKRVKEEEHRLRKVALNICKDVKKFWLKIEKLVLYKHQLELDEKKKKALDKQLEFLLGQTERYSTMLAENLVGSPAQGKLVNMSSPQELKKSEDKEAENDKASDGPNIESQSNELDMDEDYGMDSEDEPEDDEHTIEEDEALITKEERDEELAALKDEIDLPLEVLLRRYSGKVSRETSPEHTHVDGSTQSSENGNKNEIATILANGGVSSPEFPGRRCGGINGFLQTSGNHHPEFGVHKGRSNNKFQGSDNKCLLEDLTDEQDDEDFYLANGEEKYEMDDETTILEEEELAKAETNDSQMEISLLQKESEIPIEELLARYKKEWNSEEEDDDDHDSENASASEKSVHSSAEKEFEPKQLNVSLNREDNFSALEPANCSPADEGNTGCVSEGEEEGEGANRIADAAAAARSAQPTGNTFSTTKVRTKFPFLLKYPLREYQHIGLDWLVTMYEKKLNGILADEMGLGKTIMTIALLAHLACEKGIWGPHLIVVPTSVMLNWETEFLKWCPAFKILTYFGSAKERKIKRQGWLKPNSFHVCITTYRLVIQDSKVFKRKKWKYLILDEAHLIKNWKSQRWQTLLNFNSKRRILLTGTPLQNDLMELWSLMHFLMPHIFQSHQEFKDWFCNPITGMVEGQERVNKEVVDRLHNVLRPFILRRLKRDVEKQLPSKHEHVIYCRLSKRQRNLYEDFIASSETQATLASANFFGMISVIMQLRKVCNHPDLFEGRPIVSSFDMSGIDLQLSSSICTMLVPGPFSSVDLSGLGFSFSHLDLSMTSWESDEVQAIATPSSLIEDRMGLVEEIGHSFKHKKKFHGTSFFEEIQKALIIERQREAKERAQSIAWWNSIRCKRKPIYSTGLRELVTIRHPVYNIHSRHHFPLSYSCSSVFADIVLSPAERFQRMVDQVESFMFVIPAARAPTPVCWSSKRGSHVFIEPSFTETCSLVFSPLLTPYRPAIVRRQVYFPDRRLIQFDCGKLQELAVLLRRLKLGGHRALIFTQMTKMLDVLEAFINLYGYTYMRLDGSTQPEERQTLMQRFNTNPKIFLFILSTRSGGVGINLVGADTVIFYDSDWNPAMDQQAQDRCHRIGQTREVHIYRLISESTIEENILKKANQKRVLDDLVIQSGGYNTEFFKKLDPMELFSGHQTVSLRDKQKEQTCNGSSEVLLSNAEVEAALKLAEDEADYMALKKVEQEEAVENQEFTEEAIGKMEDDEFVNDDDVKADEKADEPSEPGGSVSISNQESVATLNVKDPLEAGPLTFAGKEDDFDMLADVKEMAAAAAASGQTILSFENQLRPIDRYAVRFLELWDPIVDKTATESQIHFEEKEWELDRIEKLKQDMEADIDDDEEPLVFENWDTDIATEVYRQRVETLTKHQLLEEEENAAWEREIAEYENLNSARNHTSSIRKLKSKKKTKKAKFKSLKNGGLADAFKSVESTPELMPIEGEIMYDDEMTSSGNSSPCLKREKKRKQAPCSEERTTKKSKKLKKTAETPSSVLNSKYLGKRQDEPKYFRHIESSAVDADLKLANRSKVGKKISITPMPLKRVLTIKAEKPKKKGTLSKDPLPDFWLPQEDAALCAAVDEYGPNWSLVSEILYGISSGGRFRGRYRHPVHCSDRFRELVQKYVFSGVDAVNSDKACNTSSGKSLLKVTEDHFRILLDVTSQLSDPEHLVQKHFFALLSSAWRFSSHSNHRSTVPSENALYSAGRNHFQRGLYRESPETVKFSNLTLCGKLVSAALFDDETAKKDDNQPISNSMNEASVASERLDITLELLDSEHGISEHLPSVVSVSIPGHGFPPSPEVGEPKHLRSSQNLIENRFRVSTSSCVEDTSAAVSSGDTKSRPSVKSQGLGKHKQLLSDSNKGSRAKLRKTAVESSHARVLPPERAFHPIFGDFGAKHQFASTSFTELGISDVDFTASFDDELSPAREGSGLVPHEYDPDFISGLGDCCLMPHFTDVG